MQLVSAISLCLLFSMCWPLTAGLAKAYVDGASAGGHTLAGEGGGVTGEVGGTLVGAEAVAAVLQQQQRRQHHQADIVCFMCSVKRSNLQTWRLLTSVFTCRGISMISACCQAMCSMYSMLNACASDGLRPLMQNSSALQSRCDVRSCRTASHASACSGLLPLGLHVPRGHSKCT
jgi:hypothetical protein